MTVSIRRPAPVAHLPLVLDMLRKLEAVQLIDTMILWIRHTSCPTAVESKPLSWPFSMATTPSIRRDVA